MSLPSQTGCKAGWILEGFEIRPDLFSASSAGLRDERSEERARGKAVVEAA